MLKQKPLLRFLSIFLLSYAVLVALHFVPFVHDLHVRLFTVFQELMFNLFHPTIHGKFDLLDVQKYPESADFDFTLAMYPADEWSRSINKRALTPSYLMNQRIRIVSQGPLLLLGSLIIATPTTWRRKLVGVVVGMLLLYFFQSIRFTFMLDQNALDLRTERFSIWISMCRALGPLVRSSEFSLLLMIPVWAIACLDMRQFKKLFQN
ncbi:MAG: hypothetical protein AAFR14_00875 [Bacteroidota bacterium]